MTTFRQSDFITHALKMVVPMRREFGRNVNVQTMLSDRQYAHEVFEMALSSSNAQLREQAAYLQRLLGGPRQVAAAPSAVPSVSPAVAAQAPEASAVDSELGRLQARQAEKYRTGLR